MAKNKLTVKIKKEDFLETVVGKIRNFYLNNTYYEHDDGAGSIDGNNLIEAYMDSLSQSIDEYEILERKDVFEVIFDVKATLDFYAGSGYRSSFDDPDDALEDMESDIKEDPIAVLSSMIKEYGIRVDPMDYFKEQEPDPEDSDDDGDYDDDDSNEGFIRRTVGSSVK